MGDMLELKEVDVSVPRRRGGPLGYGAEGSVWKAVTGRFGMVAFKIYNQSIRINTRDMREIDLIKHSKHPNIVQLFALVKDHSGHYMGYLMEYMSIGNLSRVIYNEERYPYDWLQIYSWIQQICRGLQHLHIDGILHRDIKPNNILLGKTVDDLKICDFGMAREDSNSSQTAFVGTLCYMAPELIEGGQKNYGKTGDIYSVAVTIWEIIHRRNPYGHLDDIQNITLCMKVIGGERPILQENHRINPLLTRGWHRTPAERPQLQEFIRFAERQSKLPISKKWLLLLGGMNEKLESQDSMFLLNYTNRNWQMLSVKLPMKLEGLCAAVLQGEVYICGGKDGKATVHRALYKLDNRLEWRQLPAMRLARVGAFSVELDGEIWVMGGFDGRREKYTSVEKYNPVRNEWTDMPPMNHPRFSCRATVINERIYVCGHWEQTEYFDQLLEKWIQFAPELPIGLIGAATVVYEEQLLILGGARDDQTYQTVWSLDTEVHNEWRDMPSMLHNRSDFTVHGIGEEILAIGGCEEYHVPCSSTEIFDGKEWIEGPALPDRRAFFATVLLSAEEAQSLQTNWNSA